MTDLPPGLSLFPFQERALDWLSERDKAIVALEQGLGKTVVAAVDAKPPLVVISTAAMKYRWARELRKWRPDLKVQVFSNKFTPIDWDMNAWIINYDIFRKVKIPKPLTLVADECHKLKNPDALRTSRIISTAKRVDRVRYLSGTPMLSRPEELYQILRSVGGTDLHWKAYARRFCSGWETPWGTYDSSGHSNLDELADLVAPKMLRLTKRQVAPDLPPKTYRIIEFEHTVRPQERDLVETWDQGHSVVDYDKECIRLPSHPIPFQALADVRRLHLERTLPDRIQYVRDVLNDDPTKKVVVFAHHRFVVDSLHKCLEDLGAVKVMGGTKSADVDDYVQRFQNSDNVRVFVGNLQAAGEGLTLTAASHVILVEPSWVPAEIDQAADRCHRIVGTTQPVLVDLLTVQESIDARMLFVASEKLETIDQVIKETPLGLDGSASVAVPQRVLAAIQDFGGVDGRTKTTVKENVMGAPAFDGKKVAKLLRALADEFEGAGGAAPKPEPKTDTDADAGSETELSLADVRKTAAELLAAKKRDELQAILKKYKADKLSALDESNYAAFVESCREELSD